MYHTTGGCSCQSCNHLLENTVLFGLEVVPDRVMNTGFALISVLLVFGQIHNMSDSGKQ